MEFSGRHLASKKLITYEVVAFACIILIIWLDEVLDIPYLFLGAEATPINWKESLFESIIIAVVAIVIINDIRKIFQQMKYLEGMLPICASCKKIRDQKGNWHPIESYVGERSEAVFSHGICPDCFKKLYPELGKDKK